MYSKLQDLQNGITVVDKSEYNASNHNLKQIF